MAATPLSRSCPIRIISVYLLVTAGLLLRVLFLDREGHISAEPHYVPREEALILAANQPAGARSPGRGAGALSLPGPEAHRLRLSGVATPPVGLGFLEPWMPPSPASGWTLQVPH
jgi:hypothetical protein